MWIVIIFATLKVTKMTGLNKFEKVSAGVCILWFFYIIIKEKSAPFEPLLTFMGLFGLSRIYPILITNTIKQKAKKIENNYNRYLL